MRLLMSVAVLSLAAATSVSAQTTTEQPAAQPAPTEAVAPSTAAPAAVVVDAEKKSGLVCRKEIPTGSHFPVKVCTTAEQRKSQRSMAQRAQESMQGPTPVIPN